jgi:hypothetical protein
MASLYAKISVTGFKPSVKKHSQPEISGAAHNKIYRSTKFVN